MSRRLTFVVILSLVASTLASTARATLTFFYDPNTGNVSFDTTNTRSGVIYLHYLDISTYATPIRFRTENFIDVFGSGLTFIDDDHLGNASFSNPVYGLHTIGDILPSGLDENTWRSLFQYNMHSACFACGDVDLPRFGEHGYNDMFGGGMVPPAEFIYGRPEREFDNNWDLVDPNTLDWAETATLVYRPWNGELLIDTTASDSGYISAYLLESDNEFLPDGFNKILDVPVFDATADTMGLFADAIKPGIYSIGRILQPGLSLSELRSTLTTAKFHSKFGSRADLTLESEGLHMNVVIAAVPEPSTLLYLLSMTFLAGSRHRRRLT